MNRSAWSSPRPACLLVVAMCPIAAWAQAPAPDWPPELYQPMSAYRSGDLEGAQRLCEPLMQRGRDERLRREAATLHALASMCMPSRSERLDGRARLMQLAAQDADLLERPECQLALGTAQLGLGETASALHHLDQARRLFERTGEPDRQAEALVRLAQAWAAHGEWEATPRRFGVPRPGGPVEARRIRCEQIRRLREQAQAIPGAEEVLCRIDRTLAELLLEDPQQRPQGLRMLEELARTVPMSRCAAEAAMHLAREVLVQDPARAVELWRRVAGAEAGPSSIEAQHLLAERARPRIDMEVPGSVVPGRPFDVVVTARGVVGLVRLELRRVDLRGWLESRQGRLSEAALPVSGALLWSRDLESAAGQAQTDPLWRRTERIGIDAPAGAYVLRAQALAGQATTLEEKKLIISSQLQAAGVTGFDLAAFCLWREGGSVIGPARGHFWMYGSFLPTPVQFHAGAALSRLPPEARLFQDRRWTLLVEADGQMALCQGELPGRPVLPEVVLSGGPQEPRVGQEFRAVGWLSAPLADAGTAPGEAPVLEIVDALGTVVGRQPLTLLAGQSFLASVPVDASLAGRHLNLTVRCGGQTLANLLGRYGTRVASAADPGVILEARCPTSAPPDTAAVPIVLSARYPWGTPLAGAAAGAVVRGCVLPAASRAVFEPAEPVQLKGRLDDGGRLPLALHLADLALDGRPLALGIWAHVFAWNDRPVAVSAYALLAQRPAHAWLVPRPQPARVGRPVHAWLGWFDPLGRIIPESPVVEIVSDGRSVEKCAVRPTREGFQMEAWTPRHPGRYTLRCRLDRPGAEPLLAETPLEVLDGEVTSTPPQPPGVTETGLRATWVPGADQPAVHLELSNPPPVGVVLIEQAGRPLALAPITGQSTLVRLTIPHEPTQVPDQSRPGASHRSSGQRACRAWLFAASGAQLTPLVVSGVRVSSGFSLRADLVEQGGPGSRARVRVALCTAGDAGASRAAEGSEAPGAAPPPRTSGEPVQGEYALIARLIDAVDSGFVSWLPGQRRRPLAEVLATSGLRSARNWGAPAPQASSGPLPDGEPATALADVDEELAGETFLLEGAALWVDALELADGRAELEVPLPQLPGVYRLLLLARGPEGVVAQTSLAMDTSRAIRLWADAPPRLEVGDRTVAGLALCSRAARIVRVRAEASEGLHVEGLEVVGQAGGEGGEDGHLLRVALPADRPVFVRARIEAVRPGVNEVRFTIDDEPGNAPDADGWGRQMIWSSGRIEGRDTAPGEPEVVVRREVLRVSRGDLGEALPVGGVGAPGGDGQHAGGPPDAAPVLPGERPPRPLVGSGPTVAPGTAGGPGAEPSGAGLAVRGLPLSAGERVAAGQYLLVREAITLPVAVRELEWAQDIPATCHSRLKELERFHRVGRPVEVLPERMTFRAAPTAPGALVHEYVIQAVRPGACAFPPPRVSLDGRAARVRVEGPHAILTVVD